MCQALGAREQCPGGVGDTARTLRCVGAPGVQRMHGECTQATVFVGTRFDGQAAERPNSLSAQQVPPL